jgi:hypothetical protein
VYSTSASPASPAPPAQPKNVSNSRKPLSEMISAATAEAIAVV